MKVDEIFLCATYISDAFIFVNTCFWLVKISNVSVFFIRGHMKLSFPAMTALEWPAGATCLNIPQSTEAEATSQEDMQQPAQQTRTF